MAITALTKVLHAWSPIFFNFFKKSGRRNRPKTVDFKGFQRNIKSVKKSASNNLWRGLSDYADDTIKV